jgi:hypothetical protein
MVKRKHLIEDSSKFISLKIEESHQRNAFQDRLHIYIVRTGIYNTKDKGFGSEIM